MKIPLKVAGVVISSILGCGLLSCLVEEDSENTLAGTSSSATTTASGSSFSSSQSIYVDLTNGKVSEDNATWSAISTTKTKLLNESVKVDYTKDESGNSTGLVRINLTDTEQNTAVHLSGTMTTGGVKIQTSTAHEAGIYLNGVSITSSSYPCIDITKGGSASVFLVDGTENSLVDGRSYGTGYGEEYSTTSGSTYTDDDGETVSCTVVKAAVSPGSDSKGTLYCKGSMSISGNGSLSIIQGYKNCIASKDGILTIESGTYDLTSSGKNGLFAYTGVIVDGGSITFNGTGSVKTGSSGTCKKANAIKTDSDNSSGYVKINGGTLDLTASYGKGISSSYVYMNGGSTNIEVSGSSIENKSITYYDADGVKTTETTSFSAEGIEGECGITVSGGTTTISSADDGVNVSGTGCPLSISGGFLYVESQGDGLDSNGSITISGGITAVSQTGGGNSPIDSGEKYKFTVTGTDATVFAVGSSDMFSESIPSSTVSPMIYKNNFTSSSSSIGVNEVIAIEEPQTYDAALLISNSLTSGQSYNFIQGGTIGGTLYNPDAKVYFPATVTNGTSSSATASTSSSSSSSNTPGSSSGPGSRH